MSFAQRRPDADGAADETRRETSVPEVPARPALRLVASNERVVGPSHPDLAEGRSPARGVLLGLGIVLAGFWAPAAAIWWITTQ